MSASLLCASGCSARRTDESGDLVATWALRPGRGLDQPRDCQFYIAKERAPSKSIIASMARLSLVKAMENSAAVGVHRR
jgi:hypothetical protein